MEKMTLMEIRPINKDGVLLITERDQHLRDSFAFGNREEARRAVELIATHYGWITLIDCFKEELTQAMAIPAEMQGRQYKDGDVVALNGQKMIIKTTEGE